VIRDWRTTATSIHRDWAHPWHIGTRTGCAISNPSSAGAQVALSSLDLAPAEAGALEERVRIAEEERDLFMQVRRCAAQSVATHLARSRAALMGSGQAQRVTLRDTGAGVGRVQPRARDGATGSRATRARSRGVRTPLFIRPDHCDSWLGTDMVTNSYRHCDDSCPYSLERDLAPCVLALRMHRSWHGNAWPAFGGALALGCSVRPCALSTVGWKQNGQRQTTRADAGCVSGRPKWQ
jgi:hypothetical protein